MSQETMVPQELLKKFNGAFVYRGRFDAFMSRGEHFITRDGNRFLRNGVECIYDGPHEDYALEISGGLITQWNRNLYRNGVGAPINKGRWSMWRPDSKERGILVQTGSRIFRNGTEFICETMDQNWMSDFQGGVIIQRDNQFLRNGKELICQSAWERWVSSSQGGFVIELHNRFLRNGTELVYEGMRDNWWTYRNGIMVQYDEKDGTKSLVYYNPFDHMASPFDD